MSAKQQHVKMHSQWRRAANNCSAQFYVLIGNTVTVEASGDIVVDVASNARVFAASF